MKRKSDNILKRKSPVLYIFLLLAVSGTSFWALSEGYMLLMSGLVLSGIAFVYLCSVKDGEEFKDKRVRHIYHMTSWATLQFSVLCFAFGVAFLISIRNISPQYSVLGFHLVYISCGILLLYSLFHLYFSKKYGA